MQAAEANERKYQQQTREIQHRQLETEQRVLTQQATGSQAAVQQLNQTQACRDARKELEFVSSIRTVTQDEMRMRTNAAISNVNAACGSNTPLMQEPQKVIVTPGSNHPVHLTNCNAGFCYDASGNTYNRSGSFLTDQNGRTCQAVGNMVQCH